MCLLNAADLSEHSTTPTKGRISSHVSVSTMRELHKVTTERDQLRFELEKVSLGLPFVIPLVCCVDGRFLTLNGLLA